MERIAYIQVREDGLPYSAHGAAAARGFETLGYRVHFFQRSELESVELAPNAVVVGGVGTIRAALERLGAAVPSPLNLPAQLEPFWGRRVYPATVGQLRAASDFPVFVKPAAFSKLFEGRVVRTDADLERLLTPRNGFPLVTDETPVIAQDVVDFISEWRVYVVHGVVQGVSHYNGDPLLFPAANVIRMAIGAYAPAPAGYAADFGVTRDGRTLLVEVNDGYSLGHGGLVADRYARLLLARWEELAETPPGFDEGAAASEVGPEKVSWRIKMRRSGWARLHVMGGGLTVRIHLSDVFDPFEDMVEWGRRIETADLPALLEIDEEGTTKVLRALPEPTADLVRLQITARANQVLLETVAPRTELAAAFKEELRRFFTEDFDPKEWDYREGEEYGIAVRAKILSHPWLSGPARP